MSVRWAFTKAGFELSTLWAKAHLLSEDIRKQLQTGLEKSSGKTFDDFMPKALAPLLGQQPKLSVLIVHDKADKITAFKHSASMAEQGSNITLHQAHKLGHIAILADEACANAVVQFAAA
jgi:pimeloyl-ACP methyl ester carboxylesterase